MTTATWIAGAVSLAGILPAAGFFSKDEIVASVLHSSPLAGLTLLVAVALTAAYAARATRLGFFGPSRGEREAHESPLTMTVPLVLLAAAALGLGAASSGVAGMLGARPEALSLLVAFLSLVFAAFGGIAGWIASGVAGQAATQAPAWRALGAAAHGGWGVDAAVSRFVVRPITALARATDALADRLVIDGLAEGVASATSRIGAVLSGVQNGDGQWYVSLMATGVVLLVAAAVWLVSR